MITKRLALLTMLASLFDFSAEASRLEVEILPFIIVGTFDDGENGRFNYKTQIHVVNVTEGKRWDGTVRTIVPAPPRSAGAAAGCRYTVRITDEDRDVQEWNTGGDTLRALTIRRFNATSLIEIFSDSEELCTGAVVLDGPDGVEVAVSAFYRIENAETGGLTDSVTVPVVAGGTASARGHHERVAIPVNVQPGQRLGFAYMLEDGGGTFDPHGTAEIEAIVWPAEGWGPTVGDGGVPVSLGVLTIDRRAQYQPVGAWSLHNLYPEASPDKGFIGMLELRLNVTGRRLIRGTAFVYERGDDGTWKYTTVEVKHLGARR